MVYALIASWGEVMLLCVPMGNSYLKILIGYGGITALICYCLFRPKSKPYFAKILGTCYLSAILLGGILLGVENIFRKESLSLSFMGILVVALVWGIEITYQKWTTKKEFYEVEIYFSPKDRCVVTAFVDSGNGLIEPISKMPVSVLEAEVANQYRNWLKVENYRIVPFHSIGKDKGIMEAYYVEKMEIKREGENVVVQKPMIAITKDAVSVNGKYQMILHPEMIG